MQLRRTIGTSLNVVVRHRFSADRAGLRVCGRQRFLVIRTERRRADVRQQPPIQTVPPRAINNHRQLLSALTTSVLAKLENMDPLALDRQVCFALAAASRSVIALYRPVLQPLGLTHPQYLVMLALWERSPRTVSDIGATLLLEPATLSPLLKRLEAAGLVTRARSVTDERALDVRLTEDGAALRSQAEGVPPQIIDRLGLPVAELERIRDDLTKLIEAATVEA